MERCIKFYLEATEEDTPTYVEDELEDSAVVEISNKIMEGYSSGELFYECGENVSYRGFWEVKRG